MGESKDLGLSPGKGASARLDEVSDGGGFGGQLRNSLPDVLAH